MFLVAACGGADEDATTAPAAATATPTEAAMAEATAVPTEAAMAEPTPYTGPGILGAVSFIYSGPVPTKFGESPDLAAKVASGDLPAVEDRLPKDFFTMQVVERIGDYGGTWRRAFTGPNDNENQNRITPDYGYLWDMNGVDTYPFFFKGGEFSDDGKTFTYFLRDGWKWSDGETADANDYAFAYNSVTTNEEINPGKKGSLGVTDFAPSFEMVDNLTIRYTFEDSTPAFGDAVASSSIGGLYIWGQAGFAPMYPEHYSSQFHIEFGDTDKIDGLIDDEAHENWAELFKARANAHRNVDMPCLGAWCVSNPNTDISWEMTRNPYFFAVDPEGNQLPYINDIKMQLTETAEVLNLKAMSGEVDYQQRHIMLDKLPVLRENEERGNYTTYLNPSLSGSGVLWNQTWVGDDEVEKWLRNKEFRQALAMGINRPDFDTVFLGLGEFRHPVPGPDHPFYLGPGWDLKYMELDVAEANKVLDDLGLTEKDSNGMRMRLDGKGPLIMEVSFVTAYFQNFEAMSELIESHWENNLGISVVLAPKDVSVYGEHRRSNKNIVFVGGVTGGSDTPFNPSSLTSDLSPLIADWYATDGSDGEEPTENLSRLVEIYNETFPLRKIDRKKLYQEGLKIQIEEVYATTFKSGYPGFMGVLVQKNNFRNAPKDCVCVDHIPAEQHPEQFFFEGGKNDAGF